MALHNYEVRVQVGNVQTVLWRANGTPDHAGVTARQMFEAARLSMNHGAPLQGSTAVGKLFDDAALQAPEAWTEVILQGPDGLFDRALREKPHAAPVKA